MIYGYLRVSSDEQDVNSQRQGVDKYARDKGWKIDRYITDEGVSGGKDPDKRALGPLLESVQRGDVIISSEISRLGRDLYMVMDILHFCMERGAVIHTVKDKFVLGDDIQSKVLAFAFGLSAEIERQMIRQRTREGLRLRMRMGVLVGRPFRDGYHVQERFEGQKEAILEQFQWGVPMRRLASNFGTSKETMARLLHAWGVKDTEYGYKGSKEKRRQKRLEEARCKYKDEPYRCVNIEREVMKEHILRDETIPQIAEQMSQYSYEQVYDTILCDPEFNELYRRHGQTKVKKARGPRT